MTEQESRAYELLAKFREHDIRSITRTDAYFVAFSIAFADSELKEIAQRATTRGNMKLNPQERHEQCEGYLRMFKELDYSPDDVSIKYWTEQNDEAVAAYYGYKTVVELELAVKACWR